MHTNATFPFLYKLLVPLLALMLLGAPAVAPVQAQGIAGGAWDPIPDNSTMGTPIERHEGGFVMAGGKFYLMLGRESRTVDIYDPMTNTWSTGPQIPTPRSAAHHLQPVVIDGLIFAVNVYMGGCCAEGETGAPDVYIYDPLTNAWYTGRAIPEDRRRGSTAAVFYQDTIYIMGGLQFGHGSSSTNAFTFVDAYNPFTGEWETLPNMPRARDHFGAAIIGDKIYAAGGRDTGMDKGTFGEVISEVDVYDISDNQWTTLPAAANIPTARGGTATAVLDNFVIVLGGELAGQNAAFNEAEALDTTNNTWVTLPDLTFERHGTTATVCNGTMWIAGGSPTNGGGRMINLERYNPTGTTMCNEPAIVASSLSSADGNLGSTPDGTPLTRNVTINNTGGNQATFIETIDIENDGQNAFEIAAAPSDRVIIGANGSLTIQVTFTPQGSGQATADLVIETPQKGQDFVLPLSASVIENIDRDDNNVISASDVLYVINRLGGDDLSADVDGDGDVDGTDVQQVLNLLGQPAP